MTLKRERDAKEESERMTNTSIPLLAQADAYDRCNRCVLGIMQQHALMQLRCVRDLNNTGESRIFNSQYMTVTKLLP